MGWALSPNLQHVMGYVKKLWYYVLQKEKENGIRNKQHFKKYMKITQCGMEHNAMSRNFSVVFTNGSQY